MLKSYLASYACSLPSLSQGCKQMDRGESLKCSSLACQHQINDTIFTKHACYATQKYVHLVSLKSFRFPSHILKPNLLYSFRTKKPHLKFSQEVSTVFRFINSADVHYNSPVSSFLKLNSKLPTLFQPSHPQTAHPQTASPSDSPTLR